MNVSRLLNGFVVGAVLLGACAAPAPVAEVAPAAAPAPTAEGKKMEIFSWWKFRATASFPPSRPRPRRKMRRTSVTFPWRRHWNGSAPLPCRKPRRANPAIRRAWKGMGHVAQRITGNGWPHVRSFAALRMTGAVSTIQASPSQSKQLHRRGVIPSVPSGQALSAAKDLTCVHPFPGNSWVTCCM